MFLDNGEKTFYYLCPNESFKLWLFMLTIEFWFTDGSLYGDAIIFGDGCYVLNIALLAIDELFFLPMTLFI